MTSLDIAETLKKRHADVLRNIENLQCLDNFTQRKIVLSLYKDAGCVSCCILKKYERGTTRLQRAGGYFYIYF